MDTFSMFGIAMVIAATIGLGVGTRIEQWNTIETCSKENKALLGDKVIACKITHVVINGNSVPVNQGEKDGAATSDLH